MVIFNLKQIQIYIHNFFINVFNNHFKNFDIGASPIDKTDFIEELLIFQIVSYH